MNDYLSNDWPDSPDFVSTFDELPLWSAPFGMLLLKHVPMQPNWKVLDIGCGAGFPLLELAQRLGQSCQCYGLDPWQNAIARTKEKIRNYQTTNVEIIEGVGEDIPFADQSLDLIVSNLGINNVADPDKVIRESHRVLKPGGHFVMTTNLTGHWKEFYIIFEKTLTEMGLSDCLPALEEHIAHRGSADTLSALLQRNGFHIRQQISDHFEMRFLDGSAFLRHYFVNMGFLPSWKKIILPDALVSVFDRLEENLNAAARSSTDQILTFSVPMLYIEASV